jgi:hypothetical protein
MICRHFVVVELPSNSRAAGQVSWKARCRSSSRGRPADRLPWRQDLPMASGTATDRFEGRADIFRDLAEVAATAMHAA